MKGDERYQRLHFGGAVMASEAVQPRTGGWRLGLKPRVRLSDCINCLLCWLYCPEPAVLLAGTDFYGFDYEYCKGCEICGQACPTDAITMVEESTPVGPFGREGAEDR